MDLIEMYPAAVNSRATVTLGVLNADSTSIEVLDGSILPEAPNLLVLGIDQTAETVLMTAKEGNTLTVERAIQGTAIAWPAGTQIARNFTAKDWNDIVANLSTAVTYVENMDASDVGARPDTWMPTASDVGASAILNSVLELKSSELTAGSTAQTLGYYTVNDGGGATYIIRAKADDDVDDGGSIIELDNGFVAELVVFDDTVNAKQFGAIGDGTTDETVAFANCLDFCTNNNISSMFVSDGVYIIDSVGDVTSDTNVRHGKLFLPSNFHFRMSKNCYLKVKPTDSAAYACLTVKDAENVVITGGNIIGDVDEHTGTTGEYGFGIMVDASKDVTIDDIRISKCWGDCIDLRSPSSWVSPPKSENQNIKILNCVLSDSRRQGISVESGIGVIIENCTITGIRGTNPQSGIDIESNGEEITENIVISNCTITDCYRGIALWSAEDCVVENCYIDCDNYQIGSNRGSKKCTIQNCFLNGSNILASSIKLFGNTIKDGTVSITAYADGEDYENVIFDSNTFDNSCIVAYKEVDVYIKDVTISNNTFKNLTARNPIDIWYVDEVKIVRNTFKDLKYGLQVFSGKRCCAAHNYFEKIMQTPIYFGGCRYPEISNNRIFDCVNEPNENNQRLTAIALVSCGYPEINYNFICGGYGDVDVTGVGIEFSSYAKCMLNTFVAGIDNGKLTRGIYINSDYGKYLYNDLETMTTGISIENGRTGNQIKEQFYSLEDEQATE